MSSNGVLTHGITLSYKTGTGSNYTVLKDLQEIPDIGADVDNVEVTTLDDAARRYRKGLKDYGDLEFTFLYDNSEATSSYRILRGLEDAETSADWKVAFPDNTEFTFSGMVSTKIGGAGVGDVVNFTAVISLSTDVTVTNPA